MSYAAIRRDALAEIIADRQLQSTDFDAGISLIDAIRSKQSVHVNSRIEVQANENGVFVLGPSQSEDHYVVFDLAQIRGKDDLLDQATALLVIQKTLRFAETYWSNGVLKKYEKVNPETKRGIVFPFPISRQTNLRVVVDLAPDADRLSKRERSGRYLLVFKFAKDDAGANETVSLSNFRRFLSDLEAGRFDEKAASPPASPGPQIDTFSGVKLEEIDQKIDPHQNFERWMHLLTNSQRSFVEAPLIAPRRIDGPAGSGKTVTLALTAIQAMKQSEEAGRPFEALFVTHSEASRRSIETILKSMDGQVNLGDEKVARRLEVATLQSYCAGLLRQDLSSNEFVDPDAYDAKQLQTMYVEEAIRRVENEFSSYEKFLTPEFRDYFKTEALEYRSILLQHEIAVVIKGRSKEDLEIYKKIPPLSSGLPVSSDSDKGFVWRIYEEYRKQLVSGGQFDTDDVILTALSQLSTPIWRRRRIRDGFDALFIDETHLFNMNELSVFHHLTKEDSQFPIAFAVDRSQAVGDRGWEHDIDLNSLLPNTQDSQVTSSKFKSIFRSSPDIVNLAFSVTSAGASLFTNFDDPLTSAHSSMSFEEEKKANHPIYVEASNDEGMIDLAYKVAEEMKSRMGSTRGDIAIIATNEILFSHLTREARDSNKPVELLKQRGDFELTARARETGRFVISMPDYVGGLEFDGVIIVGADDGRLPPISNSSTNESKAYLTYAAHNRLYVSISRARYQVAILASKERGPSAILKNSFDTGALIRE